MAAEALSRLMAVAPAGGGFVRIQADWIRLSLDAMAIDRPEALPDAVSDLLVVLERAIELPPR